MHRLCPRKDGTDGPPNRLSGCQRQRCSPVMLPEVMARGRGLMVVRSTLTLALTGPMLEPSGDGAMARCRACPRRDAGAVVVVGRHARSELAMSALRLILSVRLAGLPYFWSSSTTRTLTTSSNSLSPAAAAAAQSSGGVRDAGMIGSEIMFKSEPRPEDYGLTLPDFMAASTSSASRLRCLWSRSNISRLVTSVARSRISAASVASLRSFSREA